MKKEDIAKIQLYLGVLLLIVTLIGSFCIFRNVYLGKLVDGVHSTSANWEEVQDTTGVDVSGDLSSDLITFGMITWNNMFAFGAIALVLVIQSVMLILQGLKQ